MKKQNDNRMLWIRNVESIKESDHPCFVEHEFASEVYIPGVLNYENEKILCSLHTLEPDQKGLYHYLIRIRFSPSAGFTVNRAANKKGYYFKGGVFGELMSLFSLHFQCRFYHIASYEGEMTKTGLKVKTEYDFSHRRIKKAGDEKIYPEIFDSKKERNFAEAGLTELLNSVRNSDEKKHQGIALASYSYLRGLREIMLDEEMSFIRMVAAIETLSKNHKLKDPKNPLAHLDEPIKEMLNKAKPKSVKDELKLIFAEIAKHQELAQKFVEFITQNSKEFVKKEKDLNSYKITSENLEKWLRNIYKGRSSYLHEAEPMHLSRIVRGFEDTDVDLSHYTTIDNRQYTSSNKLPRIRWFGNIVRACLLNYIKAKPGGSAD